MALASCAASAATLDGIAAKVNDAVITIGDVSSEIRRNPDAYSPTDAGAAYSNALNRLVERRLMLRVAADRKMEMQEWLVDNRIREIVKDNFGGDMNRLNATLAESKVPITDWRNVIRDEMIVSAVRFQMVDKNVAPKPSELLAHYKANKANYREDAKTTVSVILLRPSPTASGASVSTRGEEILGKLEQGADFAELARLNSADSHAKDGGVWKDVKPEEAFRPEIAAAISKLKPGEFSNLINLDGWGFIVRKDSESPAKNLSFSEAYRRVESDLRREQSKIRYKEWMDRLRADAYIKINPMPAPAR